MTLYTIHVHLNGEDHVEFEQLEGMDSVVCRLGDARVFFRNWQHLADFATDALGAANMAMRQEEPVFVCSHCDRPVELHGAEWWSHVSLEDKDACGIRLMDRDCVKPYPEEEDE
jgi:hypothetical protein